MTPAVVVRTTLEPGDLGAIIGLHGVLYARESGFDTTFEAYVAEPLGRCAAKHSPRERIWVADCEHRVVGSIAIVEATPELAQLRWFLVDPAARGRGLGTALVAQALTFAAACAYGAVFLWTVSALGGAARIYRAAGFDLIEQRPGRMWGVDVVEERYERKLGA
jgi:GNAT superfamily N-acetyltransferase